MNDADYGYFLDERTMVGWKETPYVCNVCEAKLLKKEGERRFLCRRCRVFRLPKERKKK